MTRKEVNNLPVGLYQLFWKNGGSSLAAVGDKENGNKWFAPINWVGNIQSSKWALVKKAKLLVTKRWDNKLVYES